LAAIFRTNSTSRTGDRSRRLDASRELHARVDERRELALERFEPVGRADDAAAAARRAGIGRHLPSFFTSFRTKRLLAGTVAADAGAAPGAGHQLQAAGHRDAIGTLADRAAACPASGCRSSARAAAAGSGRGAPALLAAPAPSASSG
jgi:hypothetical protein